MPPFIRSKCSAWIVTRSNSQAAKMPRAATFVYTWYALKYSYICNCSIIDILYFTTENSPFVVQRG